jgi:predicted RNase H-like HicB family nuclease
LPVFLSCRELTTSARASGKVKFRAGEGERKEIVLKRAGKSEPFKGRGHHQRRIWMASVRFTAVLEPAEEGGYVVKCVELPVATKGETREEALANLKEAIEGYLEVKAERLRERAKGERVEVIVEASSALMA